MNDAERRAHRLFETLDAMLARQAEEARRAAFPPPALVPRAPHGPAQPPPRVGPTLASPALDDRHAAPSQRAAAPAPSAAAPPVTRGLPATAPMLELPPGVREQLALLPSTKEPPYPPCARTEKVQVMRGRALAETAPLGDDSIARSRAVLPIAASRIAADAPSYPTLTLDAYASLCAELKVWPERVADIFTRYRVESAPAWSALHAAWEGQLAARPDLRAAFDTSLATFERYLRMLAR